MNLIFKTVDKYDILFLYDLLKERIQYPKGIATEQKDIPTLTKHTQFVLSFLEKEKTSYKSWHIIILDGERVGALVLKKDGEWGYHVLMKYWNMGIGQRSLAWLIEQNPNMKLIANIKAANFAAQHIAEKLGHKLVSYTYVREPDVT